MTADQQWTCRVNIRSSCDVVITAATKKEAIEKLRQRAWDEQSDSDHYAVTKVGPMERLK